MTDRITLARVLTVGVGQPGNVVGPGFILTANTSLPGPWPVDTRFDFTISLQPERINTVVVQGVGSQTGSCTTQLFVDKEGQSETWGNTRIKTGDPCFLLVELWQGGTTLVDSLQVNVTWDETTGLGELIQRTSTGGGTVTGGLTPEQSAQLARSDVASQFALNGQALSQVFAGVVDALEHPPYFFQCTDFPLPPVNGTGTLSLPPQTRTSIVTGLTWLFSTVPKGAGRRNGFVTRYSGRPLQLVARYVLDHNIGITINAEVTEWDFDRTIWLFRSLFPSEIGYDVQPGFEAQFQFVRFCLL